MLGFELAPEAGLGAELPGLLGLVLVGGKAMARMFSRRVRRVEVVWVMRAEGGVRRGWVVYRKGQEKPTSAAARVAGRRERESDT